MFFFNISNKLELNKHIKLAMRYAKVNLTLCRKVNI
jgi:hypothetical protein